MATPRKHWFRVEDRIRREAWDNDTLAFAVRLLALMNERWARDGRSADDADEVIIDTGELCSLAGCQSVVRALSIARRLVARSSCVIDALDGRTRVRWRKYSEIQELRAPRLPRNRPGFALSAPAPAPAPAPSVGFHGSEPEKPHLNGGLQHINLRDWGAPEYGQRTIGRTGGTDRPGPDDEARRAELATVNGKTPLDRARLRAQRQQGI